jgi:hypothetical protein
MNGLKFGEVYIADENVKVMGYPDVAVMILGPSPSRSWISDVEQVEVLVIGTADRSPSVGAFLLTMGVAISIDSRLFTSVGAFFRHVED